MSRRRRDGNAKEKKKKSSGKESNFEKMEEMRFDFHENKEMISELIEEIKTQFKKNPVNPG